jgi:hypothetical protein
VATAMLGAAVFVTLSHRRARASRLRP